MKSICKKILLLLIISALPNLSIAAETTSAVQMTDSAVQPAPLTAPAVTAPSAAVVPQTSSETPRPQPSVLVGFVDLTRISTESESGKAGQTKLTEMKTRFQGQVEAKRKQLDKQRAAIEAKLPTLSPQQRESKAKEFQKKVEDYQKFLQKADNELQELQQELSRSLIEKIESAASEYGKSNNLALVTVKRDLLYLGSNVIPQDVTEGIMKLISAMKP